MIRRSERRRTSGPEIRMWDAAPPMILAMEIRRLPSMSRRLSSDFSPSIAVHDEMSSGRILRINRYTNIHNTLIYFDVI